MNKKTGIYIFLLPILIFSFKGIAQEALLSKDTLSDKINLLIYTRIISDAKGNIRADENAVANFKLMPLLNLEAGIRQGERPQNLDSYYHYKLELQTKSFWKTVRILARISDNVINYLPPSYRKTNKLFAIEAKYHLSKHFQFFMGAGYVFSSQQNNSLSFLPTNDGVQSNYPIFKVAVKYLITKKAHVELTYGSYDVFNPYALNQAFGQVSGNFDLSRLCTLFTYFRYQYNKNIFTPNNYFFSAGIMFHLVRA